MSADPDVQCDECGASLRSFSSCQEHFHALLFLEAAIPGGPGELAHFYAVASYGLQHPTGMGYTVGTVLGLRSAVAEILAGSSNLEAIRKRVRWAAAQAGHVTRRPGDAVPAWPIHSWPMVITDVLGRGVGGYAEAAEEWAGSIIERLSGVEPVLAVDHQVN